MVLRTVVRSKGLGWLIRDLFDDVFKITHLRWFHGEIPELPPREGGERWRLLCRDEAEGYLRRCSPSKTDNQRMVDVALDNDHLVLAAECDGRLVGRLVLGRGWVYLPRPIGRLVRFPPDTCYYYDKFVEKPYRRKGIGGSASPLMYRVARDSGLERGCAALLRTNQEGRRRWTKLGFPWWDSAHVRLAGHLLWLRGRPWRPLGILEMRRRGWICR